MDTIEIHTLIDVTNTNVNRLTQGTVIEIDQQRNFITLMQCIEIRSIVSYEHVPEVIEYQDIKKLGFGSSYKGKHKVWKFIIKTDRPLVYQDDENNPVGLLIDDIHEVPIIKNLTETININKTVFDCKDTHFKNTIIKLIT